MTRTSARLLIALMLLPVAAAADGRRDAAQALVREGNALLDRRACVEALDRFTRALAAYPEGYRIHVNIGSAHQCLGDRPAAVTHFERFLLRAEPRRDGAMIADLRARFDRERARVAGVRLTCPVERALVAVDGQPVGRTPLLHAIYLEPGRHALRVTAAGQPAFERSLELSAGSMQELRVPWIASAAAVNPPVMEPPPVVEARPVARASTPIYKRWWFWTLIGVGVAGATVGGVLGARAAGDGRPVGEAGTIDLGR